MSEKRLYPGNLFLLPVAVPGSHKQVHQDEKHLQPDLNVVVQDKSAEESAQRKTKKIEIKAS